MKTSGPLKHSQLSSIDIEQKRGGVGLLVRQAARRHAHVSAKSVTGCSSNFGSLVRAKAGASNVKGAIPKLKFVWGVLRRGILEGAAQGSGAGLCAATRQ